MRIAIGADHAGFSLKEHVRRRLEAAGHQVTDVGTNSADSTDYPDYAVRVGHAVERGEVERGILVCYTGVGMSIAANKVAGVRAGLGVNPEVVRLIRAHNDANVLTIGASLADEPAADELVDVFLSTSFDGGRHARRVGKITALEHGAANADRKGE